MICHFFLCAFLATSYGTIELTDIRCLNGHSGFIAITVEKPELICYSREGDDIVLLQPHEGRYSAKDIQLVPGSNGEQRLDKPLRDEDERRYI